MNLSNNNILITGGSSGLGLELAQQLLKYNNKIIICGRSKDKLLKAKMNNPKLEIYACDISIEKQCIEMVNWIQNTHGKLNVLVNNAAIVHISNFLEDEFIIEKAILETDINFIAPIRLTKLLIPVIENNTNPSVINITTGLVYVPRADYPFYNATKSALHAFTQGLRFQLKDSNLRVIEVMFPAVKTPWHKGNTPKIAITPENAIQEMIKQLQKGKDEIRVAKVKLLYFLSRFAPKFAFKKLNNLKHAQQ